MSKINRVLSFEKMVQAPINEAYPTNQALLTELYCLMQETISFIGGIPVSFLVTKSTYGV